MKRTHQVYDWLRFNQTLGGDCLLCGCPAREGLCPECEGELPFLVTSCERCGVPLSVQGLCGACQQKPPPFASATAAFRYQSPVSDLIIALKFRGRLAAARPLGRLFVRALSSAPMVRPDVIVPVPLHLTRLRERGYNQALELARPVARHFGIPLAPDLCVRSRLTASQSNLDLEERQRNVRGAFASTGAVPRRIAIIDDVMTSGSTAAALTETLMQAGAEHVQIWALARAAQ